MDNLLTRWPKRLKSHHDAASLVEKYQKPEKATEADFSAKLEERPENIPKAMYVHVPWCDRICSFCNMNRKQADAALTAYPARLAAEFEKYGKTRYLRESRFEAIFFGGGTPTVLSTEQLATILSALLKNVNLVKDCEFTFESTLHNLQEDKIRLLMQYGVNRISVGIQTFSERGRQFYNRTYNRQEALDKLRKLQKFFHGDVCVDIIYNFPGETGEEVKEDARILKDLGVSSVSFYSLMVHEGSLLSLDIREGAVLLDPEMEKDYGLYEAFVREMLEDDRYQLLELTKIARKGGDNYRYIRVRNHGGDTFPVGTGAGGTVGNIGIYHMKQGLSFYTKYNPLQERFSKLSGLMQFPEFSKRRIETLLTEEESVVYREKMKQYQDAGLLKENETSYDLTSAGVFWGNNLIVDTITEILEKTLK